MRRLRRAHVAMITMRMRPTSEEAVITPTDRGLFARKPDGGSVAGAADSVSAGELVRLGVRSEGAVGGGVGVGVGSPVSLGGGVLVGSESVTVSVADSVVEVSEAEVVSDADVEVDDSDVVVSDEVLQRG